MDARMAELDAKLAGPVQLNDYRELAESISDMKRIMAAPPKERWQVVASLIEQSWIDVGERRLLYVSPVAECCDLLDAAASRSCLKGMVETRGLEPLTFALRTRRSPN